jgi:hypothetical protein
MKGKKIEWFFLLFIRGTVLCSKYLVLPSIIEATLFVNALCNATVPLFGFEYVGCLFYLQPCELVLAREEQKSFLRVFFFFVHTIGFAFQIERVSALHRVLAI